MTTAVPANRVSTIPEHALDVTEKVGGRIDNEQFTLDNPRTKWAKLTPGLIVITKDGVRLRVMEGRDKNKGRIQVAYVGGTDANIYKMHWKCVKAVEHSCLLYGGQPSVKSPHSTHSAEECDAEEARSLAEEPTLWDGHYLMHPEESAADVTAAIEEWKGDGVDSFHVRLKPKDHNAVVVNVTHVDARDSDEVWVKGKVVQAYKEAMGMTVRFVTKWAIQVVDEHTVRSLTPDAAPFGKANAANLEKEDSQPEAAADLHIPAAMNESKTELDKASAQSKRGEPDDEDDETAASDTVSIRSSRTALESVEHELLRMRLEDTKRWLKRAQNRKAKRSVLKPLMEEVEKAQAAFDAAGLKPLPQPVCTHVALSASKAASAASPPSSASEFVTAVALRPVLIDDAKQRFNAILDQAKEDECTSDYFCSNGAGAFMLTDTGRKSKAQCVEAAVRAHWSSIAAFNYTNFQSILLTIESELEPLHTLIAELQAIAPAAPSPSSREMSPSLVESNKKRGRAAGSSTAKASDAKRAHI